MAYSCVSFVRRLLMTKQDRNWNKLVLVTSSLGVVSLLYQLFTSHYGWFARAGLIVGMVGCALTVINVLRQLKRS